MEANIRKLQEVRYKDGYSDEAAADENRDLHGEARAMLGQDEITQEDIDDYNSGRLSSPVANSQLEQNGQGFAEPPEVDESETVEVTPTALTVEDTTPVDVILWEETALAIAGMCEGQDYDAAMKMIKRVKGEDA